MIATEFLEGQGLGNQLWVYAACRSIADELGMPHKIFHQEKFKGHSFVDIDCGSCNTSSTKNEEELIGGLSLFNEEMFFDPDMGYFSSDFDQRVLRLKPNTKIHGLFQSEKYFFGDPSRAKKYIKLKPKYLATQLVDNNVCVINIRGGEYKRHKKLILPQSYWINAMRNMTELYGVKDFIAVSDDDRYVKALLPGVQILKGNMAEDFLALYQCKFAILSNSSWGYFPVKTGVEKTCVIAPMHWARFSNKYYRWASPANLYESWMWQDMQGSLYSYTDCLQSREITIAYYREHYYVSTTPSVVMNPGIRGRVPSWLKKPLKKVLSLFFPRHIG